ncbi:MAG: M13 family metallopeptidase [Pelobium sp.]
MSKVIYNSIKSIFLLGVLALSACSNAKKDYSANDIVLRNVDSTANPGDDFFKYANGNWIKNNPIPEAYSSWGIGDFVENEISDRLKKINEDAMKANAVKGSNTQKIGDFYKSGMDSLAIEKLGIKAIKPQLDSIAAIKTPQDILNTLAYLTKIGSESIFGVYVSQDNKNSDKMMLKLNQTGLGLPNRDYYFNADPNTTKIREDYVNHHLPMMFKLSGEDEPTARKSANAVYEIEKFLAGNFRKLEDLRDSYKNYNKMAISGLDAITPNIKWKPILNKMNYAKADSIIIGQPEFYKAVNNAITKFPVDSWKSYLKSHLLYDYAPYLNKDIEQEDFRFYGTVIFGVTAQLPRWKRVLDTENSAMGEILGQLFVKDYFPEKTKKRYTDLVNAVKIALNERIQKLDWMTPETKEKAYDKLAKITSKVGYPDNWKDYSDLEITADNYAKNVMRAKTLQFKQNAEKLGKPVAKNEWVITPQTYSAYYNRSNNDIVLPAAIFTIPGVKDEEADDAIIYGYAAASTIGHEITHGFDDQGRQYDAKGNLKGWWQAQDSIAFSKRAQMLINQFNSYVVLDSLQVNGKATLGENIADLGGIMIGLDAFKKTDQYKKGEKINGFTPLQRYFMGYAMGWLGHQRDQALANQILTNTHAPAFLRVNGPFSDVDDFYEAFHIKPGDKMYLAPDKRVRIW